MAQSSEAGLRVLLPQIPPFQLNETQRRRVLPAGLHQGHGSKPGSAPACRRPEGKCTWNRWGLRWVS